MDRRSGDERRNLLHDDDALFDEIHLRDYLAVIWRHRFLVIAVFTVVLTTVMLYTISQTPQYVAQCKVVIQEDAGEKFDIEVVRSYRYWRNVEFFETQVEVLKSRPVAEEVVRKLNLVERPGSKPGLLGSLKQAIVNVIKSMISMVSSPSEAGEEMTEEQKKYFQKLGALYRLMGSLRFSVVRDTSVVMIACMDPNPIMARNIANATAEVFSKHSLELKVKEIANANLYLSGRLTDIKEKLVLSENELKTFQEEKEAISLDRRIENLTEQQIQVINELNTIEKELAAKQSHFETLEEQTSDVRSRYASGDVGSMEEVKRKYREREIELSKLLRSLTEQHPKVKSIRREMKTLKQQIDKQRKLLVAGKTSTVRGIEQTLSQYNTAKQELGAVKARKIALERVLTRTKQGLKDLLRLKGQYTLLQREVESNQKLYDMVLLRQKETSLKEAMQISDVKIIEPASMPIQPVKPRRFVNFVLGCMVGVFAGIGMAFLLDYFDTTLKSKDEIHKLIRMPVLGVLPDIEDKVDGVEELGNLVTGAPSSPYTESFRSLRTSLKYVAETSPKVLLVTSSGPSEGKTTIAANLAEVFAKAGERVLLIDADLRKPRIHAIFDFPRTPGVTDSEEGKFGAFIGESSVEGLSILTCGTNIGNPSEFLHLWGKHIVDCVKDRFVRIIIDSPPVNAVADPAILAKVVDGVLFVVSAGTATKEGVTMALEQMHTVNAPLVGAVVNNLAQESGGYYYYYQRHHGYRGYYGQPEEDLEETPETLV